MKNQCNHIGPTRSKTVDDAIRNLHRARLHQPDSDIVSVLDQYRESHRRHMRRLAWRRFFRDLGRLLRQALPEAFKLAIAIMLAWWATVVLWALVAP